MNEVFGTESGDDFTLEVARNISKAVDILHEGPHVIGDFHESCVLLSDSAAVTLIDTDLFHISERQSRGGRTYRSLSGRGEYTPPELQGSQFGVAQSERDHDLFALAVAIYKLLMDGAHPFDGEYTGEGDPPPLRSRIQAGHFLYSSAREVPYRPFPDSKSWEEIPDSLRDMFARCFDDGHDTPRSRPSAHEWTLAIEKLIAPPAPEENFEPPTPEPIAPTPGENSDPLSTAHAPRGGRRFLKYGGAATLLSLALVAGAVAFSMNSERGGSAVNPPVAALPPTNVPTQSPSIPAPAPTPVPVLVVTPPTATPTPIPTLLPTVTPIPALPRDQATVQTLLPIATATSIPTPTPTLTVTATQTSTPAPILNSDPTHS